MKCRFWMAVCLAVAAIGPALAEDVAISGVKARQRWPWNNLVDVDFTLSAKAGETYRVAVEAKSASKGQTYVASTYVSDPIVKSGANRITWDFGADYPNLRATDMKFAVAVAPYTDASAPLYMVIDLSGGPDATSYPVRYTSEPPAHVQGATDEKCQTTELWLRRVRRPAKPVVFGTWLSSEEALTKGWGYYGMMSDDYWLGVFEVTQKQYNLVMGTWPSYFTREDCRASRPVEGIYVSSLLLPKNRNPRHYPEDILDPSCFFGKINAKTGLRLTLPSTMEIEWATRAGRCRGEYYYSGDLNKVARCRNNSNPDLVPDQKNEQGRYDNNAQHQFCATFDLTIGTAAVGTYDPNAWGFYDLQGNVSEWLCESRNGWTDQGMAEYLATYRAEKGDETLGLTADNPIVDYDGENSDGLYFRSYGGCWNTWPDYMTIWRINVGESASWCNLSGSGFRVALPIGR